MTMSLLARARVVIVAAFGEGKRAAINAARRGRDESIPISRLMSRSPAAVLLLDVAAAGMR